MARKKTSEPKKAVLFLRMLLNVVLTVALFGLPLFLPTGSLNYWNAWLFLGIFVIGFAAILVYFAVANPTYARKRMQANEEEVAQRIVMALLVLCVLAMLVIAGFNYRHGWSDVPVWLVIVGAVVMSVSFVGVFLVMKQNSYASRVVEIQRDQKLIDTGSYAVVRHPMYSAFAIMFCASPLVLGSYWSLIPAFCIPLLLTFRIRNEEDVLIRGLKGYRKYTKKVRYRLVPFVW
jgi:protein-S-isoprenylcysteine O-methyltransferase Ste14